MLRLISLLFAIAALIIAGFITRYSVMGGVETRPSTVMAVVVNGVSVFYLPMVARVSLPALSGLVWMGVDVRMSTLGRRLGLGVRNIS